MIDQVSNVQENFRDLLRNAVTQEDPILEEEALKGSISQFGEDNVVNLAMSLMMRLDTDQDPSLRHLILAVAVMDDLDTLGMEVRHKT